MLIACVEGYRTDQIDCGAPELCKSGPGPTCVLQPGPDPMCSATGADYACEGSVAVACRDGHQIRATDCGDPTPGGERRIVLAYVVSVVVATALGIGLLRAGWW